MAAGGTVGFKFWQEPRMRLKDKIAWITGGGAGIGRATAVRFAQEGARVEILELDEERGASAAAQIQEVGGMRRMRRM